MQLHDAEVYSVVHRRRAKRQIGVFVRHHVRLLFRRYSQFGFISFGVRADTLAEVQLFEARYVLIKICIRCGIS